MRSLSMRLISREESRDTMRRGGGAGLGGGEEKGVGLRVGLVVCRSLRLGLLLSCGGTQGVARG